MEAQRRASQAMEKEMTMATKTLETIMVVEDLHLETTVTIMMGVQMVEMMIRKTEVAATIKTQTEDKKERDQTDRA